MSALLLDRPVDVDRRRRCRASTPVTRQAQGSAYPADPPKVEEIIAVMRA